MTPSGRDAVRSHGILQYGGGGAEGRLVPLFTGEWLYGAGGAGLVSFGRAVSKASLCSGPWLDGPSRGHHGILGVRPLGQMRSGQGARSEAGGRGPSVPDEGRQCTSFAGSCALLASRSDHVRVE
jgi:hypothetical protein